LGPRLHVRSVRVPDPLIAETKRMGTGTGEGGGGFAGARAFSERRGQRLGGRVRVDGGGWWAGVRGYGLTATHMGYVPFRLPGV
jgi:hypothetical protein